MSDRVARRSKFDERPPERRRSQSPRRDVKLEPDVTVKAESPDSTPATSDAAQAAKKKAAEAAARISAMLKTKKASSPAGTTPVVAPKRPLPPPGPPPEDTNERGQYVRKIEVNDLRNRYLVVKESTIEDVSPLHESAEQLVAQAQDGS